MSEVLPKQEKDVKRKITSDGEVLTGMRMVLTTHKMVSIIANKIFWKEGNMWQWSLEERI